MMFDRVLAELLLLRRHRGGIPSLVKHNAARPVECVPTAPPMDVAGEIVANPTKLDGCQAGQSLLHNRKDSLSVDFEEDIVMPSD